MSEVFDQTLEILSGCAFEYGPDGLSNHGPMAAEALCSLGREDAALSWVKNYRNRLEHRGHAHTRITDREWRSALGDLSRAVDWSDFFQAKLAEDPWQEVLNRWLDELAPGLVGAALHGVIRTGHAVRALGQRENDLRLRELAEGLAYWAASYQSLPEAGAGAGGWLPSRAVKSLEPLPEELQEEAPTIVARLRPIQSYAPFKLAISLVDSSVDPVRFISDLTETFAKVYLANSTDMLRVITFVHTVTGPAAVAMMMPYLKPAVTRKALRYCWQANAALYSVFNRAKGAEVRIDAVLETADDLVDWAVDSGDEHAIKFTEACLRLHHVNRNPIYLAAARDAIEKLGGPIGRNRSTIAVSP
jgi:hypothetical protein